jgi:cytochrome c peroxidase
VPDGRLPGADKGESKATRGHIRDIFYRMGFNDREIVALCGAHALGRCHANASGYVNPWTNAETTFSNEYFRLLIDEKWTVKKTHEGKPWTGPLQYENKDGNLMMLPADLGMSSPFCDVLWRANIDVDSYLYKTVALSPFLRTTPTIHRSTR